MKNFNSRLVLLIGFLFSGGESKYNVPKEPGSQTMLGELHNQTFSNQEIRDVLMPLEINNRRSNQKLFTFHTNSDLSLSPSSFLFNFPFIPYLNLKAVSNRLSPPTPSSGPSVKEIERESPDPIKETSSPRNEKPLPICIVGGGISGINLGLLLQDKGHYVEVYEKEDRPGGKIETFRMGKESNEVQVEMCPLFFIRAQNYIVEAILRQNLTIVAYNESDRLGYIPTTGRIYPFPTPSEEEQIELRAAVRNFIISRSQFIRDLEFGYLNASPELFVSIGEWLNTRGLQILKPIIFVLAVTVEGYGALEDIPALYILKLMDDDLIRGLVNPAGSFMTVADGLDVFILKMAAMLKNPIKLGATVTHLFRDKAHQVIYLRRKNSVVESVICKNVILAFPPLLLNLKNMIIDLSDEESKVLEDVKIHKYASGAHQIPGLEHALYGGVIGVDESGNNSIIPRAPKGEGEVLGFVKQTLETGLPNVFSSYSWIRGDFSTPATEDELKTIENHREAIIKKINKDSVTFYRKTTEYFPHVTTEALQRGFYEKFDSIQGRKGLYYATTLLGFEILDSALRLTEAFVNKYF